MNYVGNEFRQNFSGTVEEFRNDNFRPHTRRRCRLLRKTTNVNKVSVKDYNFFIFQQLVFGESTIT